MMNVSKALTERCYACEAHNLKIIPNVRDVHAGTELTFNVLACQKCESTSLRDKLSDALLASIYPDDYYSYVESKSDPLAAFKRFLSRSYNRHRFIPEFNDLLEVGCGRGEFLATIKNRGNVTGLERSQAARAAGARVGVSIIIGKIEDGSCFPDGSFDYVYSNHAFEHLTTPEHALLSMHRWLTPNGKLFIGIPNRAGFVARLFQANWFYLGPPLHVTNGTPEGMKALLQRCGFEIEKVIYNSDPISLPMSLWIAIGGRVDQMPFIAKAVVGILTLVAIPITALLDVLKMGDCFELHARRTT